MAAVSHVKSNTIADWAAGTVTVFNSAGVSATANATDLVRPVDWNSAHNQYITISGNTSGATSATNLTNIVMGASGNLTVSMSTAGSAGTVWFDAPDAYTQLTYQNRQLGASSTTTLGQNTLWLVPFRLQAPLSASTLAQILSFSGTITSAATAQAGLTAKYAFYSQNTADANRFDTWWTGERNFTFWNSGTSSYSYSYNVTSGSSAGSNLGTASIMSWPRLITVPVGTTMQSGLWLYGMMMSTSSAGYSAAMSRMVPVMDGPVSIPLGMVGSATNASIAYVDAGTWTSATTAAFPASVSIGHTAGVNNMVPWFKVGAL
jgi:hypothetical protein